MFVKNLGLAGLLILFGCDKAGSVVGPTPIEPPQESYGALPAHHYLVDAEGNNTRMWVILHAVSPLRGSVIEINDPCGLRNSGRNCYDIHIEVGMDDFDNPYVPVHFEVGFSVDGVNNEIIITRPTAFPNRSATFTTYGMPFAIVPRHLLIRGSHIAGGTGYTDPAEDGSTAFLLDYSSAR